MIVDANTRITEDVLQKLNSLSSALARQEVDPGWSKAILTFIGEFILLSIVVSLFFTFLIISRFIIFKDWIMVL